MEKNVIRKPNLHLFKIKALFEFFFAKDECD